MLRLLQRELLSFVGPLAPLACEQMGWRWGPLLKKLPSPRFVELVTCVVCF